MTLRVRNSNSIPPVGFGFVEGFVGELDEGLHGFNSGLEFRDADAGGDVDSFSVIDECMSLDRGANPFGDFCRLLGVGVTEQEHEFLAAVASEDIFWPDVFSTNELGELLENEIPGVVSVGVVDFLKVIEVEKKH